jgi:toxin-antitoxin system PIN domain toxin
VRALLDVNVLLALLDRDHAGHRPARDWLTGNIDAGWASCPITQNGFVRIVSQPNYPSPISSASAIELLAEACGQDTHEFWPCEISVLASRRVEGSRLHGPGQVTDAYLLALATAHGGRLVTFDRSVPTSAVPGGEATPSDGALAVPLP